MSEGIETQLKKVLTREDMLREDGCPLLIVCEVKTVDVLKELNDKLCLYFGRMCLSAMATSKSEDDVELILICLRRTISIDSFEKAISLCIGCENVVRAVICHIDGFPFSEQEEFTEH